MVNDPMDKEIKKLFYSDTDLAARYGIHRTTIWRWVRNQGFPEPERFSTACTRWSIDQVETWEKEKAEKRIRPRRVRKTAVNDD